MIRPGGCYYFKTPAECNPSSPGKNNHLPALRARLAKILAEYHMARPGTKDEIYALGKISGFMCSAKHILSDIEYGHLLYLCRSTGWNNNP